MKKVNVFVRDDDTATIVCPSCQKPKNASVGSYKNKTHDIKVRCACDTVFMVHLDFRRFYRKPTDLPGSYKTLNPRGHGGGSIQIKNISQGGIGFIVEGTNTIEVGHRLMVSFKLDDRKNTALEKEVVVQSVTDDFVGCRFTSKDLYEKALGFYLQP